MARDKIEVTWVDSHTRGGWDSAENALAASDEIDHTCFTTGYKFRETDDFLFIVMSQGEPDLIHTMMSIPTAAILKIKTLK